MRKYFAVLVPVFCLCLISCDRTKKTTAFGEAQGGTVYEKRSPKDVSIVGNGNLDRDKSVTASPATTFNWAYGDANYSSADSVNYNNTDESYAKITENEFLSARSNPLSTFSIDVDKASYSNVRRYINDNMMPPPNAVRAEEMINYFDYEYPQPQGDDPFSASMEMAACPWNANHDLIRIGLLGRKMSSDNIPASNLVFLVDVSGSMDEPDKLPLLQSSFGILLDHLKAEDRVAIVTYAGNAGLVLPFTSGSRKEEIMRAIDKLRAGGSTAGGAGITLAYKIAKENFIPNGNNRIILATDGDFNVGVNSEGDLEDLIVKKRDEGVYLTVLGFGTGNYKDSKMEILADKGNGNYAYIDGPLEAKKTFSTDLTGTLFTIAKDVKLQLEFNPAYVKAYRLIGYEDRRLNDEDFNNDKKDAGELGAGTAVTALYEVIPAGSKEKVPDVDSLKYQKTTPAPLQKNDEVLTLKLRYKLPASDNSLLLIHTLKASERTDNPSGNFIFAASVAEFSMLLRNSQFKANSSYAHVINAAQSAKGTDENQYRAEFIQLAEKAKILSRDDSAKK
jgi:Ca-activated chloride channel family protein